MPDYSPSAAAAVALTVTATRYPSDVSSLVAAGRFSGAAPEEAVEAADAGRDVCSELEFDFASLGSVGSVCVDWFAMPATAKSLGRRGVSDFSHALF